MAATVRKTRYFNHIESLSLSPKQEAELGSYVSMVKRVCKRYTVVNPVILDTDDLIQMSLVKLALAIKSGVASELPENHRLGYYTAIVHNSCINQLECHKAKLHAGCDYNETHGSCSTDVDRIHDKLYIEQILDGLRGTHRQEILIHYYGLDTPALDPMYISDIVPLSPSAIACRRFLAIESIQRQLDKGELPSCHLE